MRRGNIITGREIVASIIIIASMILVGIMIASNINLSLLEKYQQYDSAVQIDSEEMFRFNMDIDIGNAFVYGELVALDPVSYDLLGGEYSYIKVEEQEYRNHPRPVKKTYKKSDGTEYTKEEMEDHWTWDTIRTKSLHSSRISFLGVEFSYGKIPFPGSHYITTVDTGYHERNVYYGTGTYYIGTVFAFLSDGTVSETSFYNNHTIPETIDSLETGYEIVLFWVVWILLTAVFIVTFCWADNRWLE